MDQKGGGGEGKSHGYQIQESGVQGRSGVETCYKFGHHQHIVVYLTKSEHREEKRLEAEQTMRN